MDSECNGRYVSAVVTAWQSQIRQADILLLFRQFFLLSSRVDDYSQYKRQFAWRYAHQSFRSHMVHNGCLSRENIPRQVSDCKATDIFNTSNNDWTMNTYGIFVDKRQNYDRRGISLSVIYNFQPRKSKYKGSSAAESELKRLWLSFLIFLWLPEIIRKPIPVRMMKFRQCESRRLCFRGFHPCQLCQCDTQEEDAYRQLLVRYPRLFEIVSLGEIASCLNISRRQLHRIREILPCEKLKNCHKGT